MKNLKCKMSKYLWGVLGLSIVIGGLSVQKVSAGAIDDQIMTAQLAELSAEGKVYTVSKDGQGDYSSIQLAINSVESGDTLLIMPGIYEEALNIDHKTVNLIGTDKEKCVIQYNTQAYSLVPLNIAAGKVSNLTIYGIGNGQPAGHNLDMNIADWESIAVSDFTGYAIHVESDYSYGKELQFSNCRIVSDSNYCVGMGCRGDFSAIFDGCELISRGEAGCLYMHDAGDETFGGVANVILRNCTLKNYQSPYVISAYALHETNETNLTFQNVHVSTVAYEKKSIYNNYNQYHCVNVDMLTQLAEQGMLQAAGYQTYLANHVVKKLSIEESCRYQIAVRECAGELKDAFTMPEGISYIKMTETDGESKAKEQQPDIQDRTRAVINVWNTSGEPGAGWCGLSNVFLTEDSFGNTLVEMNYSEKTAGSKQKEQERRERRAEIAETEESVETP